MTSPPTFPMKALRMFLRCRRMTVVMAGLGVSGVVNAQSTDLIISEYVEGSGSNKYIELYNGTASSIILTDYQLQLFSNGATAATTTVTLSSTLASGATIVYQNSGTALVVPGAINNTAVNFNGDDAIALYKVSTSSYVDIIGQIGCAPATGSWAAVGRSTKDMTLVRNANICNGVTNNPVATCMPSSFLTLVAEWTAYAIDDVSYLGSHTTTCTPAPTVDFDLPTSEAFENVIGGTATVSLTLSSESTYGGTLTISLTNGAGCSYGAGNDYTTTPAGPTTISVSVAPGASTASFTININNDNFTEADETITFTLTGTTGDVALETDLTHVFTIQNDDNTPTVDFTTGDITAIEGTGPETFNLSINPAGPTGGAIEITVTDGPGAVYGTDYTTSPIAVGGVITLNYTGTSTTSFTVTPLVDGMLESTELLSFSITAVPVGFLIGTGNTTSFSIEDLESQPTLLEPGDIAVVGINTSESACTSYDQDAISFICFKQITTGTKLILTDNGYGNCTSGFWRNTEGIASMERTGTPIPAGQVITFIIDQTAASTNVTSNAPDADWNYVKLNTGSKIGISGTGEELFFMQGGTWTELPSNLASYDGTVIFGFSLQSPAWGGACGSGTSDRPPGMDCFSMAPTSGTNSTKYDKYIGPLTLASQHDWTLAIADPTNWMDYASCTLYNASTPNWALAPTLPISAGGVTAGLWRGSTSSDWFTCKNWDDAKVPDATTDVTISEAASNDCTIGILGAQPAGTDGVCASLALSSASTTVWNFGVVNGSALTIGGPLTINHSSGTGPLTATVGLGSVLTADAVSITGNTSIGNEAALHCDSMGSTLNVSGNLTIGTGGLLDLEGVDASHSGVLNLGGNYSNAGDESHFADNFSVVIFNGGSDQTVTIGTAPEFFYDFKVDKPSHVVALNGSIRIRDLLDLTQGIVLDTLVGTVQPLVILEANATVANTNHSSYVNGPVQKYGGADFTFPIGEAGYYRPCGLESSNATDADAFTAEYFQKDPNSVSTMIASSLNHISMREYWDITRSVGTLQARVVLSWFPPASGEVTPGSLNELRVAHWDGVVWDDRGNGGITGAPGGGTIRTAAVELAFSPWALASTTSNNPLPIDLLNFTAVPRISVVDLAWSTASEQNNDHFTVERSADAEHFEEVLRQPGAGNSEQALHYSAMDRSPLPGHSYYRLRQTDHDGSSTLSDMVPVLLQGSTELTVLYDGGRPYLRHFFPVGSLLEMRDGTGRLLVQGVIQDSGLLVLPVNGLAHGVYVLRLSDGVHVASTRFVY